MKKKILILFAILLFFVACSKYDKDKLTKERYVVTSPEIAELIYLIGAEKNVVGVTVECDYPNYYKKIKKVGNFGNVSIEKVIALKPTVVFTTKLEQDKLNDTLKKLDINVVAFYPHKIEDLIDSIVKIGKITHREKRAGFVADSLLSELSKIKEENQKIKDKPKVYVEIYNNPVMSASNDSFLGQLISYAGGRNIFEKLPRDYSQVNQEEIIKKNPDVIICLVPNETKERIAQRKGWTKISAVKTGKIYTTKEINPDLVLRAGSRVVVGIKKLKKLIYNEQNN